MKINPASFYSEYERLFGPLRDKQRSGLDMLLEFLEGDGTIIDPRHAAYMLATVKHECADTWEPLEEFGKGKGRPYGFPFAVRGEDGKDRQVVYYGRGYVQLTWKGNYGKLGDEIDEDLVSEPWRALEPSTAYRIMSRGMRKGLFTGHALSAFINDAGCDYLNCRRVINGLDKAELIAYFAVRIESCLR